MHPVASTAIKHWGTCPPLLDFQQFIFSLLWSKLDSQLPKYCVVCEICWYRCQQLTALSISRLTYCIVAKLNIHRAAAAPGWPWSPPWVPHDLISSFAPPGNKSWRRHWMHSKYCVDGLGLWFGFYLPALAEKLQWIEYRHWKEKFSYYNSSTLHAEGTVIYLSPVIILHWCIKHFISS